MPTHEEKIASAISVEVLTDSVANDVRLTTLQLRHPRLMHSEFNTHRMFSRSASSTRAIPLSKQIAITQQECVYPLWTANESGMQGGFVSQEVADSADAVWARARDRMIECVRELQALGIHKQDAGRLLEPFSRISVVLSSTSWHHFMDVRPTEKAYPYMRALAEKIQDCLRSSTPTRKARIPPEDVLGRWRGMWHLPYMPDSDLEEIYALLGDGCSELTAALSMTREKKLPGLELEHVAPLISSARCARVSYMNHGGGRDFVMDFMLGARLLTDHHWGAVEHAARPATTPFQDTGNFAGWLQLRKMFEKIPATTEWPL